MRGFLIVHVIGPHDVLRAPIARQTGHSTITAPVVPAGNLVMNASLTFTLKYCLSEMIIYRLLSVSSTLRSAIFIACMYCYIFIVSTQVFQCMLSHCTCSGCFAICLTQGLLHLHCQKCPMFELNTCA